MTLRAVALGLCLLGASAPPAAACTLALGRYHTTGDYRAAKLQGAERVVGSFQAEAQPPAEKAVGTGQPVISPVVRGVVTDVRGKAYPVQFSSGGLVDDTDCGVFQMPVDGTRGSFWLKRRGDGHYQLLNVKFEAGN
jgi:hypothetical protein